MADLIYYSQRKSQKSDRTMDAINNRYGDRNTMERQFHLYCASACENSNNYLKDAIEWGTVENGALERKVYIHPAPEPEPEEEEAPEQEAEP